jgi:hypothetical protein
VSKRYQESPRLNAAGLATGSILALIVCMAVCLVFDVQPAEAKARTALSHTSVTARA